MGQPGGRPPAAAADPQPPLEAVEGALALALGIDNVARRQAEEVIKTWMKLPGIVSLLLTLVGSSAAPEVRQLAAVLLRKRVAGHWGRLPAETRAAAQAGMLAILEREPVASVRRAVTQVVGAVAKVVLPAGGWPALMPWVDTAAGSPVPEHRELALQLLGNLVDAAGANLAPHFAAVQAALARGLADSAPRVRAASLRVASSLVEWVTDTAAVSLFRDLVPLIIAAARAALEAGEEDLALVAFEILLDLVEAPAPVLAPTVPDILHFALVTAASREYELATRRQALEIVGWLARHKPKMLTRRKLVGPVLAALCPLLAEAGDEGLLTTSKSFGPGLSQTHFMAKELRAGPYLGDILAADAIALRAHLTCGDLAGDIPLHKCASQAVDTLALELPAKHVLPHVRAFAAAALTSPDPHMRRAAVTALAVISEGCATALRPSVAILIPPVAAALADSDAAVRGQAAFALGQFAEYLQPEAADLHADVLPPLFAALSDADAGVQERACYAMDVWCESLGPDAVALYMGPLLAMLLTVLKAADPPSAPAVQEMALSAVSSVALAAGAARFGPILPDLLPLLAGLLSRREDPWLLARARAVECLGVVASTPEGVTLLRPHLDGIMAAVLAGFELDFSELREYTFGFYAHAAGGMGATFAPYLVVAVPLAIASIEQDDGAVHDDDDSDNDSGGDGGAAPRPSRGLDDVSSDEDDDDDDGGPRLSVRTGVCDEKAAAMQALGEMAVATGAHFSTYIPTALAASRQMAGYFHEDGRVQAYGALGKLVVASLAAEAASGHDSALGAAAVSRTVAESAFDAWSRAFKSEEDCSATAAAVTAAGEALDALRCHVGGLAPQRQALDSSVDIPGGSYLVAHAAAAVGWAAVDGLAAAATAVLSGKAACQRGSAHDDHGAKGGRGDGDSGREDGGSDGEDDEQRREEEAEELLAAVAELVPSIARYCGPDYYQATHWSRHAPLLLRKLRPGAATWERQCASGTLAEVATALGPGERGISELVPYAMPSLLREMGDEDPVNRRNAVFCAGVLCACGGAAAGAAYAPLWTALAPLLSSEEPDGGVRDNAAGALGRMIASRHLTGGVLDPAAALSALTAALPLREDEDEAAPVLNGIAAVLENVGPSADGSMGRDAAAAALVPAALRAAGELAAAAAGGATALARLGAALRHLLSGPAAEQLRSLLHALPSESQVALSALITPPV